MGRKVAGLSPALQNGDSDVAVENVAEHIRLKVSGDWVARGWLAVVVGLCGVLPLAWVLYVLVMTPSVWHAGIVDSFRLRLLGKTLLYNGIVGVVAVVMAMPAAVALGRGRKWIRRVLWAVLPAGLLMPSLAYSYGWSQFFRLVREPMLLMGIAFEPGSVADIARCSWTLAAWLWPIPAIIVGMHLRRMDCGVQLQAAADGVLWRITLRQLLSPMVMSFAIVTLLASQEFAIYEPTGISVVATEVRMVFDSGAFSQVAMAGGDRSLPPDQAARAAAALATALPLLVCIVMLAGIAAVLARRDVASGEVAADSWPAVIGAPHVAVAGAIVMVALTAIVPLGSLIAALRVPFSLARIWSEFSPELMGALCVGGITAAVAVTLALAAMVRASRWTMVVLVLCFLLGGQLLAIACIRVWNRPGVMWAYDSFPVPVMAYLARFGWIALAVAGSTWARNWRDLRMMAAVDGATAAQTARYVVWPMIAPMLAAGALLIGALSMTEVPATIILQPRSPHVLTPMIMAWVHIMRFDPMIEASLLMTGVVLVLWMAAGVIAVIGRRRMFRG